MQHQMQQRVHLPPPLKIEAAAAALAAAPPLRRCGGRQAPPVRGVLVARSAGGVHGQEAPGGNALSHRLEQIGEGVGGQAAVGGEQPRESDDPPGERREQSRERRCGGPVSVDDAHGVVRGGSLGVVIREGASPAAVARRSGVGARGSCAGRGSRATGLGEGEVRLDIHLDDAELPSAVSDQVDSEDVVARGAPQRAATAGQPRATGLSRPRARAPLPHARLVEA
mmetsp:Transcript_25317/g.84332  ORF Transcript_25317/g.84332 Transcript_25317/m.84332 type:complete len:225 (-) Transcript_25317:105-779(-)